MCASLSRQERDGCTGSIWLNNSPGLTMACFGSDEPSVAVSLAYGGFSGIESSTVIGGDKYRDYLSDEEIKNTKWRSGPPNYDIVDQLFEQDRTHVWPEGSLEEKVQRLLKTWEMEIVHKADPNDFKTVDTKKFKISVNGRKELTPQESAELGGSYNIFLQTSLPENIRVYNPDEETFESSQRMFRSIFVRGFAIEILHVYSGPPGIVYKFRHWGYMEGPFKGHAATGQLVQLFGIGIFELDKESNKIVKAEMFFDRGELLGSLVKGESTSGMAAASKCPFMK